MKILFMSALISFVYMTPAHALRVVHQQVILDALNDYDACQERDDGGNLCDDALWRWVGQHPADAFKAGKMTRLKMNAFAAVRFFDKAFAAGKGDCKDEDVKLAVVSGLGQVADQGDVVKQSQAIGFGKCFAQMKDAIAEEAQIGSNNFKNSCAEMVKRGGFTGLKAKKCQEIK